MKRTSTCSAALLTILLLGGGRPGIAQGVSYQYDPNAPRDPISQQTWDLIMKVTSPPDRTLVTPRLGAHNQHGRLRHAWRGGEVLQAQGRAYWNVDGVVNQKEFHQDDGSMKLTKGESLWEFYEDGTFLHVEVQEQGLIDMRGWSVFRGRYVAKEDGIHFEGSYRLFAYGQPLGGGSIAGILSRTSDGRMMVVARQVDQSQAAFSNPYGRHSSFSQYTREYAITVQPATR